MAHPMSGSAEKMKSDKLHRMTRDYGSADQASNISGPTNRMKQEGPEDDVGFGAESNAPKARADRSSRKNTTMANPIATYAAGGAVNRARGGRTKHKPSTHVNVIVAPQGAGAAAGGPMLPPGGNPAVPPMPPPGAPPGMGAKPPMMPPPGMGPPGMGGSPGPMPPGGGMPGLRAGGGRTYAKGGAVVDAELKGEGLKPARDKGGKVHMTAGAVSGPGRLEKIAMYGKNAHMKPQEV